MLRSAMMAGLIALSCMGVAQPADAQSRQPMSFNGSGFGFSFSIGRGFKRFESPAFERREEFFEHRRFFGRNRFFAFGGFPYYPYYTTNYPAYYPSASLVPPEGSGAALPPPPTQVADLPPCRETTEGVVIIRGTGCAHNKP
jgi:hypothetical protein